MDHLHERLDALEQHVYTLTQHTRTATRRLRWWRGLACSLVALGLLGWGLPLSLAREDGSEKDKDQKGLAQRVAALEKLLKHVSREGKEIFITGANLHIVNGLDATQTTNGLGNLIVGYNELRPDPPDFPFLCFGPDERTGSHNIVIGMEHNFTRVGGIVDGKCNQIRANFASVSGGEFNTASGFSALVSGGSFNTASGEAAVVSGGSANTASGFGAVVSGGESNVASGDFAVVSGGFGNTASGFWSAVSGGRNITQETEFGWSAGSEGDEVVVGNFRSP